MKSLKEPVQALKGQEGESEGRWVCPHDDRSLIHFMQKIRNTKKATKSKQTRNRTCRATPTEQHKPHHTTQTTKQPPSTPSTRKFEDWDWRVLRAQSASVALVLGGWFAGCLFDVRLASWLLGSLVFLGWLAGWLHTWLADWQLLGWFGLADLLAGSLPGWVSDCKKVQHLKKGNSKTWNLQVFEKFVTCQKLIGSCLVGFLTVLTTV